MNFHTTVGARTHAKKGGLPTEQAQASGDDSIRVAFGLSEWLGWLGGVNYHRNLLHALAVNHESRLAPVLFVGERLDPSLLSGFPSLPIARSQIFDRPSPAWAVRTTGRRVLRRDLAFERLMRGERIAALSHSSQVWEASGIAMLGWIPDFQHHRLPDLFPARERRARDRAFARICRHSTLVIVSSECSRRDLAAFDREGAARARVLRFVSDPLSGRQLPSRSELASRYGLEGRYFHVPNQFWVHKNHLLLVEALRIMRSRGVRPLVVATGEARDYRRSGYFESVMSRAKDLGVGELFRSLGIVPYLHVVALMRDSIGVVNPSRCEGWSTTVEEGKSLGKRVLLSDIDAHREQDPPGGVFFGPDDAEGLAAAMRQLWDAHDSAGDQQLEHAAREALPRRRLHFARKYEDIVTEAVSLVSTGG